MNGLELRVQLGLDIDGEAAGDQSGHSVSIMPMEIEWPLVQQE